MELGVVSRRRLHDEKLRVSRRSRYRRTAAAKRDTERKAGISHAAFGGAVININGKLQARKASHATTETYIHLVSAEAEARQREARRWQVA